MSAMRSAVLVGLGLAAVAEFSVAASSLTYVSTDLPDSVVGEDLWQNAYTFAGALEEFGGFNLYFDYTLYSNLAVTAWPSELSPTLTPPPPGLLADGVLSIAALSAQPSTYTADFKVTFVRTGPVAKTQAFEVYGPNFFDIRETGTALQVPEPSSALMLALGSLALLALRCRRTSI